MKHKLAAAMEDALDGIGWNVPDADAIELATSFLAYLAADLPDEMVDAAARAIAGLAKWDDSLVWAITRRKSRSDAELALTAALTVEPPRDD